MNGGKIAQEAPQLSFRFFYEQHLQNMIGNKNICFQWLCCIVPFY